MTDLADLRAENERLKRWQEVRLQEIDADNLRVWRAEAENAALKARVSELEGALEPFAKWLDALDEEFADHADDSIAGGVNGHYVTFGNLRRARSTLSRTKKEPSDGQ